MNKEGNQHFQKKSLIISHLEVSKESYTQLCAVDATKLDPSSSQSLVALLWVGALCQSQAEIVHHNLFFVISCVGKSSYEKNLSLTLHSSDS